MINFRAFLAIYIQATEDRGSYVKLKDLRNKVTIKLSTFNSKSDDASDIAEEFLNTKGIKLIGRATGEKGYILFTENFTEKIN
jgi:hypothetical protein